MISEYDHWHTDEPVCPHCGDKMLDGWQVFDVGAEYVEGIECDSCGKEFNIERNTSISYTTKAAIAAAEGRTE